MTTMTSAPAHPQTTHLCKNGHALDEGSEHLYVSPRGRRSCRTCSNRQRSARDRGAVHRRETLTHVSNAPLRQRFLELQMAGEINAHALALALGWLDSRREGKGDTSRVRRTLGLSPSPEGRGEDGARFDTVRETVRYETAVLFLQPLGLDPFEAGV